MTFKNEALKASEAALLDLLQALPRLRLLDLSCTGIDQGAAEALKAAAATVPGLTAWVPLDLPALREELYNRMRARLEACTELDYESDDG